MKHGIEVERYSLLSKNAKNFECFDFFIKEYNFGALWNHRMKIYNDKLIIQQSGIIDSNGVISSYR